MKHIGKFITAIVLFTCLSVTFAASGLLDSGVYSASSTVTSVVQRANNEGHLTVEIIPTAASGAPSVINTVQGLDSAGNFYSLCAGAAITSAVPTTVQVIHIGPGLTASAAGATGTVCNTVIPDKWRVSVANSAASGVTNALTQSIFYNTSP